MRPGSRCDVHIHCGSGRLEQHGPWQCARGESEENADRGSLSWKVTQTGVLMTPGENSGSRTGGEELLSGTSPPAGSLLARHPLKGSSERDRGPEAQAKGDRQLTVHLGVLTGDPENPGGRRSTAK